MAKKDRKKGNKNAYNNAKLHVTYARTFRG